jgi:hypothetical protein
LPGALQEVSENVMATGHYNTYMLLLKVTEHMCGIVAVVHSTAEFQCFFFFGFFSIKGISSLALLSVGCEMLLTFYLSGHFVIFQFYSVIYLGCKYEEILNNYKHIVSEILTNFKLPNSRFGSPHCPHLA